MRNTEIIDFLDNISNQLDDDDFYVEDIIKSLRLKMLDLSEAGLNSRGSHFKRIIILRTTACFTTLTLFFLYLGIC